MTPGDDRLVSFVCVQDENTTYNDCVYHYYEYGEDTFCKFYYLLRYIAGYEEIFFSCTEFENVEYGRMDDSYRYKDEYVLFRWGQFCEADFVYSYDTSAGHNLDNPIPELEYIRDYMISEFFETTLKYPVIDHKRTPGSDLSDRR